MDSENPSFPEVPAGLFLANCERSAEAGSLILGYWSARAARHIAPHHHSEPHFMLVTSGSYFTRACGLVPTSGELLIFNPASTEHDDHLESGGAFFTVTIADQGFAAEAGRLPARPTTINAPRGFSRARQLLRELGRWGPDSAIMAESLAAELLAIAGGPPCKRAQPAWLGSARDLLETCYRDPLSLGAVAAMLNVHPVYLTRCFRRHFGTTPGEYLRARRLREAAALLTQSDMCLAEIALEVGFADQPHFTHRFSDAYGISPGVYRRRTRF